MQSGIVGAYTRSSMRARNTTIRGPSPTITALSASLVSTFEGQATTPRYRPCQTADYSSRRFFLPPPRVRLVLLSRADGSTGQPVHSTWPLGLQFFKPSSLSLVTRNLLSVPGAGKFRSFAGRREWELGFPELGSGADDDKLHFAFWTVPREIWGVNVSSSSNNLKINIIWIESFRQW